MDVHPAGSGGLEGTNRTPVFTPPSPGLLEEQCLKGQNEKLKFADMFNSPDAQVRVFYEGGGPLGKT